MYKCYHSKFRYRTERVVLRFPHPSGQESMAASLSSSLTLSNSLHTWLIIWKKLASFYPEKGWLFSLLLACGLLPPWFFLSIPSA